MSYPDHPTDTSAPVLYWRDDKGIAHIRVNRPEAMNAINVPMAHAFLDACKHIYRDANVRAVWLTGAGRAFMAGGDLASMRDDPVKVSRELIDHMHEALQLLADIEVPVVASVQGAVAGGGLGLMLACDLVIAAQSTKFAVAYPLIGTNSDCSTSWGLTRIVGMRKAMEMMLLAEPFNADEAQRLSLINRVVPDADLESAARAMVERLAAGPTVALGNLKQLVRSAHNNDLAAQLEAEKQDFLRCAATHDFKEGVSAFLEKRPANFKGN